MYDVRIRVSKRGRIKFVSHLDMFRTMQRAVRRAEIPLWYTEGFNPHPYISYLLALPLGVEGVAEPIDIRLVEPMPMEELQDRLNAVMPEGLRVESAAAPFHKPAEIAFARYDVTLDRADISPEELTEALTCGELTCEKSGKSGHKKIMKTVNVSEHIREYRLEEKGEQLLLTVVLPAGSIFNLNPIQLIEAVSGRLGRRISPPLTVRTALLCEDLSEFI